MSTIGDSLSAGVFADSGGIITKMVIKPTSFKEWAISFLFEAPKYVFADGASIQSVKRRIQATGKDVISYNYAVSGATALDVLTRQAIQVVNQKRRPNVTLLMIGANDIGTNVPVEKALDNVGWILRAVTQVSDRVVLIPLPKLYLLHGNVAHLRNRFFIKCSKVWSTLGLLKPLTVDGGKRLAENQAWIEKYNAGLMTMAGPKVVVAIDVANMEPTPNYVSRVDCLHVPKLGHEKIASMVYPYTL
jgi:hypothetical protein